MYSNNAKFNHSIYHFLKIFYERSSKSYKTYSTLGNVFKNSKWTNYKIQNIKLSFVPSFIKIFVILLIIAIIIFNYKLNVFLFLDLFNNLFLILFKDVVYDYTNFILSIFLLYVYSFKVYLTNFYLYLLNPSKFDIYKNNNVFNVKAIHSDIKLKMYPNYVLNSNDNIALNQYITLSHVLFKIKNNLFWINYSNEQNCNIYTKGKPSILFNINGKFLFCFDYESKSVTYNYYLKDLNKSYSVSNSFKENTSVSLNVNTINTFNKNFLYSSVFENILNESTNILKQSRWLSRNIPLSDRFIINTNYFTEYKKLIGNNTTISKLSNNNVWASSNLNKFNLQQASPLFSNYKTSFNNSHLLDKFDESRLWLFKKMYFNTLIRYHDTVLSFKFNKNVLLAHNYFYNKFYVESIKKSLPYNLMTLDNSIKPLNINYNHSNNFKNNSNYIYNIYDSNLLSDENIDILVNLFINSNTKTEEFNFYSNINSYDVSKYSGESFNLTYKKG